MLLLLLLLEHGEMECRERLGDVHGLFSIRYSGLYSIYAVTKGRETGSC
jgi:hypothetical protein